MKIRRSLIAMAVLTSGLVQARPAMAETTFVFPGGGYGHGVGMSQFGALGMARAGYSYDQILRHYYTDTTVGPSAIPSTIRVGLRQGDGGFRLSATGPFEFSAAFAGSAIAVGNAGEWWDFERQGSSVYLLAPASRVSAGEPARRGPYSELWQRAAPGVRLQLFEYGSSVWKATEYPYGTVEVAANPSGTTTHVVLDYISIEKYLYGLGEVPSSWLLPAKQAQAVAGRSYAARKAQFNQNRADCSCSVVDDTRDQVYSGYSKETPAWTSAVDSTEGVVVTYQGAIANTLYSSSSGGFTEDNEKVFGSTAVPYLRAVYDPYDNQPENSRWRWSVSMSQTEASKKVNNYLSARGISSIGTVQRFRYPDPRGHGGRIVSIATGGGGAVIEGSSGTVTVGGDQFRSMMGLPSSLLFPTSNEPTVNVSGGHVVDINGGLHPFGGAAPATGGSYSFSRQARDAIARPDGRGGYVLDGFGNIANINGAPALGVTPSFSFNIARSIALTPSGAGAYILDGYGGIHRVGDAPLLTGGPYWNGWDIARDIVVTPDGTGGYVVDGYGGLHPLGTAPGVAGPYFGFDIARDLVLRPGASSGYLLDGWGGMHPFNGAPALSGAGYHAGSDTARRIALRSKGPGGYILEATGALTPIGGAPWVATTGYFTNEAANAFILPPDPEAYELAGDGRVAALGLASALTGGPSFDQDIARDLVLRANKTGYVLDGYGGLHPIGAGAVSATGGSYFSGQDRIKAVALDATGTFGYTLDRDGTLYPFSGAPAAPETSSWWADGSDIARDVKLRAGGGGYLLDEGGMLHAFGGAPAIGISWYQPGTNKAAAFALNGSSGYVLENNGTLHPFGSAPAVSGVTVASARDLILRADGRSGWIIATTGVFPFGGAPPMSGAFPAPASIRGASS